jgi:MFS family permease
VFTPLFIIEHLPVYYVGVFLFILAIPVVLLEHMVGKYVDTHSVKPVFIIGFFLMSFFTLVAYIFSNIYVTLFFLFLSVLGATFVEPTVEYYFFKVIHKNEVNKKYGVYRTSDSLFSLFCRFSCAFLLLFFTLKELYLYAGIILSLFLFVAVKVID